MSVKYSKYFNFIILFLLFLILFLVSGCNEDLVLDGKVVEDLPSSEIKINIDKLEIVNFHATNRCYSCITAGAYAKETVETYFKDELKEGIIIFKEIDALDSGNREIVMKYGPTSSSVLLGVYNDDSFSATEDTNIWFKLRNKQDYMNYFKGVIEEKLSGN
jgi:hypothetical protein